MVLDGVESFSPDWQNRIRKGQSLIPGLPFLDGVAAQSAVDVFEGSHLRGNLAPRLGVYPVDPANIQEKREDVSIILKGAC